jgi:hypothetical protein
MWEVRNFGWKTRYYMEKAVFWDLAPCRYCVNRRENLKSYKILHVTDTRICEGMLE